MITIPIPIKAASTPEFAYRWIEMPPEVDGQDAVVAFDSDLCARGIKTYCRRISAWEVAELARCIPEEGAKNPDTAVVQEFYPGVRGRRFVRRGMILRPS